MKKKTKRQTRLNRKDQDNKKGRIIKLGIDAHEKFHVVSMQIDGSTPKPPKKLTGDQLLAMCQEMVQQGDEVWSVYEACGLGFVLHRKLEAAGVHSLVITPIKLSENGKLRKNDKNDSRHLVLRLDRYVVGNKNALPIIRVPSPREEQYRSLGRRRGGMIRIRTNMEAQGRGFLVNQGFQQLATGWWRVNKWQVLESRVPGWIFEHLEAIRGIILQVEQKIGELTKRLEATVELKKVPYGVGALSQALLDGEVCDWKRFKNRRQISSYTGLCPGEYSSGESVCQGKIDRHGNRRIRVILIEMAWRMVRYQPDYYLIKKNYEILRPKAKVGRSQRKKTIVKVARCMSVDLWRLATEQTTPENLGLVMAA